MQLKLSNPLLFLPQAVSNTRLHQLITGTVTRPTSQTCWDYIYSTEISQLGLLPLEYWYMVYIPPWFSQKFLNAVKHRNKLLKKGK